MTITPSDEQQKRNRLSMALDQTRATEGWIHMCQVLKENIKLIEDMIFNDEGLTPDGERVLKLKRTYLLKLIEMPENLMKHYQATPSTDREFDPYD